MVFFHIGSCFSVLRGPLLGAKKCWFFGRHDRSSEPPCHGKCGRLLQICMYGRYGEGQDRMKCNLFSRSLVVKIDGDGKID